MNKNNNLSKENSATACGDWEEIKKIVKELAQSSKETDKKFQETDKKFQETRQFIKDIGKQIGGVSNSNGDVAESYFISGFENFPHFAGQDYDSIAPNLTKKDKKINLQGEYDLVLYNCSSIVIIEIKYRADKEDVEQVLKKADTFKKLFPEYKDFAIYLGLAGLHIDKSVEKEALKQGSGVIKQVGKNMVINDAHLKVF
jgi:hypothetical protein